MDYIALRDYARNLLGRIASSGWRPVFGWGGGFMLLSALHFAYIEAPRASIVLTDGYYTGLNLALAAFGSQAQPVTAYSPFSSTASSWPPGLHT